MDAEALVTLWCYVLGEPSVSISSVKVSPSTTVEKLKKAVNEEMVGAVDYASLTLWKVCN